MSPHAIRSFALLVLFSAAWPAATEAQRIKVENVRQFLQVNPARRNLAHNQLVNNTFAPELTKALMAELHFFKKVCQPTEEQFERIHRDGLAAVNELAHLFAIEQRTSSRKKAIDPHEHIAAFFLRSIEDLLPDREVVARYQEEIAARDQMRRAAAAGMIVAMVDQRAMLDPAQQDNLEETLLANWNKSWSNAATIVISPMYATLPSADVMQEELTPLQRKLWAYRPQSRTVRLPWNFEMNAVKFLGVNDLPPFPDPPPIKEVASRPKSEDAKP